MKRNPNYLTAATACAIIFLIISLIQYLYPQPTYGYGLIFVKDITFMGVFMLIGGYLGHVETLGKIYTILDLKEGEHFKILELTQHGCLVKEISKEKVFILNISKEFFPNSSPKVGVVYFRHQNYIYEFVKNEIVENTKPITLTGHMH